MTMAKIHEEIIVIKLSKLVKETDKPESAITEDLITGLSAVVEELVGSGIVVEIEQA
jgi:hypothetical protein